jgi:hypothetical protein
MLMFHVLVCVMRRGLVSQILNLLAYHTTSGGPFVLRLWSYLSPQVCSSLLIFNHVTLPAPTQSSPIEGPELASDVPFDKRKADVGRHSCSPTYPPVAFVPAGPGSTQLVRLCRVQGAAGAAEASAAPGLLSLQVHIRADVQAAAPCSRTLVLWCDILTSTLTTSTNLRLNHHR